MDERDKRAEIEIALATKWKQMGGWPGVESGMVNMTGALADVALTFNIDVGWAGWKWHDADRSPDNIKSFPHE